MLPTSHYGIISTPYEGTPQYLPVRERLPALQPDQVLLEIAASGVNRADIMQAKGLYPPPVDASPILGLEAAGVIVACGTAVRGVKTGQQVCALLHGGGYSDYAIAESSLCLPIPKGMDFTMAAALPEALFTLYNSWLFDTPPPKKAAVCIHGGSGGVGHIAIQLLKQLYQAYVFTTVGNAEKASQCQVLGADCVINYKTQDFADVIHNHPRHRRVTAVLDHIGGIYTPRNLEILGVGGQLIQLAFQGGSKIDIDMLPLLMKSLSWQGTTLRRSTLKRKKSIALALQKAVWPLLEQGLIKPVVHTVLPLSAVADAHALLNSGTAFGKVVLQP